MIPDQIPKAYYTISELAKILKVSTSALRYWEDEKIIKSVHQKFNKPRKYKSEDLPKLQRFIEAHNTGYFTLQGLKEVYLGRLEYKNELT